MFWDYYWMSVKSYISLSLKLYLVTVYLHGVCLCVCVCVCGVNEFANILATW